MELISLLIVIAAILVGLNIGANSAASAIGIIVGSNILSFRRATLIISISMLLGALLGGGGVIRTIGNDLIPVKECSNDGDCPNPGLDYCNTEKSVCEKIGTGKEVNYLEDNKELALSALLAALIFVSAATILSIPVAISHTMIGAIVGVMIAAGLMSRMDTSLLLGIFISWISTPIAAIIFALMIYRYLMIPLSGEMDILTFNRVFQILIIVGAIFLSYCLGANNIGNAVGPVIGSNAIGSQTILIILVGISMGLGVRAFSGSVVETVGKEITSMGPVMAFTSQLSAGIVIYIFTVMGIPVSTTQAVVGSIIGIGLTKGIRTVNIKTTEHVLIGWILTPITAALLSMLIYWLLMAI